MMIENDLARGLLPLRLALVGALKASGLEVEVGAILCVSELHREGGLMYSTATGKITALIERRGVRVRNRYRNDEGG